MSPPSATGGQRKAAWSFRGTDTELARSAPLTAGETVLLHGALRALEHGVIRSPAVVRLTPWTGRNPPARPLRDLTELAQALRP